MLILVGAKKRHFQVHEDLLCARSPYFRSFLQAGRRDIDGDCSICLEDLRTDDKDLTYCMQCKMNFHFGCIAEWVKQYGQHPLCPLCRGHWIQRNRIISKFAFPDLNAMDFAKYHEWIYSGTINCNEVIEQQDFAPLVSAYLFAVKVKDQKFGTAILQAMLEIYKDTALYPEQDAIALAYNLDTSAYQIAGIHRIQRFLVETYLAAAHAHWFEDEEWAKYPHEFFRDVTVAMFLEHPRKNKWALDTWKAKLEAEENDVE